jgi:hypothetical protein
VGAHQTSVNFEPAIWARLIQAPKEPISPDAARYLLSIDFDEADRVRMQELMEKSNEGGLESGEDAELDGYVNIANLLAVMHSRARLALRSAGFECPPDARNS